MDQFNIKNNYIKKGVTDKKSKKTSLSSNEYYSDWSIEAIELIRGFKNLPNPLTVATQYNFVSISELELSIINDKDFKREWDLYKAMYKAEMFEWAKDNKVKELVIKMAENDLNLLSADGSIPDIHFSIDKDTFK